jgi:hypothetical protein
MPDAWELSYHLNPLDPTDAQEDTDGDGESNIQEYEEGTNPLQKPSDVKSSVLVVETDRTPLFLGAMALIISMAALVMAFISMKNSDTGKNEEDRRERTKEEESTMEPTDEDSGETQSLSSVEEPQREQASEGDIVEELMEDL